ncbi:DUF4236 domain-containing protein [Rhodobacter capsulatus]|uniref:DUF4236 domain-containing protein n=1 Tax=Rhodobacter capsulatus TaxID=1061 RepID=UPI00402A4F88
MPFYLRDSVSLGPFRINLSKSGLGISAGIKRAQIRHRPQGPLHSRRLERCILSEDAWRPWPKA